MQRNIKNKKVKKISSSAFGALPHYNFSPFWVAKRAVRPREYFSRWLHQAIPHSLSKSGAKSIWTETATVFTANFI
jgi:hypothetical protein